LEVNEKVEENKKVRIEMTEMETIIHEGWKEEKEVNGKKQRRMSDCRKGRQGY
jgi:hypothetical protein